MPAPSLEHPGQEEMGELDRRAQVHPQHPFQVVAGEVVELALQIATGVVHQHPDRPEDLLGRRHECPLALRIGDVRLDGDRGDYQLQPANDGDDVRVRNGTTLTMHGPFMETREELGGYLFEAGDLDAASGMAARIPAARSGGAVALRPLAER